MGIDDGRIDIKGDGTTRIGRSGIDHIVGKCLRAIAGKHHGGLALAILRRVDMAIELLAFIARGVGVVLEVGLNRTRTVRLGVIGLAEWLKGPLLGRGHDGVVRSCIAIMVVHHPVAGVGGVDLHRRVRDTERGRIHALLDQGLG